MPAARIRKAVETLGEQARGTLGKDKVHVSSKTYVKRCKQGDFQVQEET